MRDLDEGGQGHLFVVRRHDETDPKEYVLKRLKNPKRAGYFDREIQAYATLDHPNILKLVDHGKTPKGLPFLVTEYCPSGALDKHAKFEVPVQGLRFFEQILAGVAYAHNHVPPVYHLDLKPQNILLRDSVPLVGDFGICFVGDGEVSFTSDGPLGSKHYCAPELRDPKISGQPQLGAADVYSLGKLLYWLFTHELYDGHQSSYSNRTERHLAKIFPSHPEFAFVDEIVQRSVQESPSTRIENADKLLGWVKAVIRRIDARGRVLDLRIPQRCLYCQEGFYRPAHDLPADLGPQYMGRPYFPEIEKRRMRLDDSDDRSVYIALRQVADRVFRINRTTANRSGVPMVLACEYCGNIQYFRLDLIDDDGTASTWKP